MRTKRKPVPMVAVLLTLTGAVHAQEVTFTAPDITGSQGDQATLSINMANGDAEICAYQVFIELPDGVTLAETQSGKYDISILRGDDHTVSANLSNGAYKLVIASLGNNKFSGTEGCVTEVKLDIADDLDNGDYSIKLTNLECTKKDNTKFNPADITCKLTVADAASMYDDGYSLTIAPIEFKEDIDGLEFIINVEKELTNIVFEVEMPSVIGQNQLYTISKSLGTTTATTSIDDDEAGNVKVIIARKSSKTIKNENVVAKLELGYDSELLTQNAYLLKIENIEMTDVDGTVHKVAPSSATIFVGDAPKAVPTNGIVTFGGDFSDSDLFDKLIDAIPLESFNTLDLTGVTALPTGTTSIAVANPNTLVRTSSDLGLTQNNVVVGNTCANLVLTDGQPFENTKVFTATNATYSRTMPAKYGTIYLPYAPDTEDYTFFELASVNGTELTFTPVDAPAANTPYLYRVNEGKAATTIEATNVKVPASTKAQETVSGDLTMKGTFTTKEFTKDDEVYFIYNNTFYLFASEGEGDKLTIAPYRAYFQGDTGGASLTIRERDGGTTHVGALEVDCEGTWFDLLGRPVAQPERGIYILNGKKVIIK